MRNQKSLMLAMAIVAMIMITIPLTAQDVRMMDTNDTTSVFGSVEFDAELGVAKFTPKIEVPYAYVDAMDCRDATMCFGISKDDQGAGDGALIKLNDSDGTWEFIGDVVDFLGEKVPGVVLGGFNKFGEELWGAVQSPFHMFADWLIIIDTDTAVVTFIGPVRVEGTDAFVNFDGGDLTFVDFDRIQARTNQANPLDPLVASAGLYEITLPEDGGEITAVYLGLGGTLGVDPEGQKVTGIAPMGDNLVLSNRFDEIAELDQDGNDVAIYSLEHVDGGLLGHGSGDMGAMKGCALQMALETTTLRRGVSYDLTITLRHNGDDGARQSFWLWAEDAAGNIVWERESGMYTFNQGDLKERTFSFTVPSDAPIGDLEFKIGIDGMRQGVVVDQVSINVTE